MSQPNESTKNNISSGGNDPNQSVVIPGVVDNSDVTIHVGMVSSVIGGGESSTNCGDPLITTKTNAEKRPPATGLRIDNAEKRPPATGLRIDNAEKRPPATGLRTAGRQSYAEKRPLTGVGTFDPLGKVHVPPPPSFGAVHVPPPALPVNFFYGVPSRSTVSSPTVKTSTTVVRQQVGTSRLASALADHFYGIPVTHSSQSSSDYPDLLPKVLVPSLFLHGFFCHNGRAAAAGCRNLLHLEESRSSSQSLRTDKVHFQKRLIELEFLLISLKMIGEIVVICFRRSRVESTVINIKFKVLLRERNINETVMRSFIDREERSECQYDAELLIIVCTKGKLWFISAKLTNKQIHALNGNSSKKRFDSFGKRTSQ